MNIVDNQPHYTYSKLFFSPCPEVVFICTCILYYSEIPTGQWLEIYGYINHSLVIFIITNINVSVHLKKINFFGSII